MFTRIKNLLGLGSPELYESEPSLKSRMIFAVILFVWMTICFAAFDAFASDATFFGSLVGAMVPALLTALFATVLLRYSGRLTRRQSK